LALDCLDALAHTYHPQMTRLRQVDPAFRYLETTAIIPDFKLHLGLIEGEPNLNLVGLSVSYDIIQGFLINPK
jgi:hypothetical protein